MSDNSSNLNHTIPQMYILKFYSRDDCPANIWRQSAFADFHTDWTHSRWNPIQFIQYEEIVMRLIDLGYWGVEYGNDYIHLDLWVLHLILKPNQATLEFGYWAYDTIECTSEFWNIIQPTIELMERIAGFYTFDEQLGRVIHRINDIPNMISQCKDYQDLQNGIF